MGFISVTKEHEVHDRKCDDYERDANCAATDKVMYVYHMSI